MLSEVSVLLIDDDDVFLQDLRAMVHSTSYGPVSAVTAVRSLEQHTFANDMPPVALVLLVVKFADQTWTTELSHLVSTWPDSSVIVLSDGGDEDAALRAVEEGAHHVIRKKKLSARIIDRALRSWMDRGRRLQQLQDAYRSAQVSEQRFQKLFNSNQLLGLTLSSIDEGRFVQVNDAFLRFTGFEREEVIGKTAKELNLWAGRAAFVDRLRKGAMVRNQEVAVRAKDGRELHVLLSFDIVDTDPGPMVLTVAQDLTGKFESILKLRQSEINLDALINSSSKPIWLVDRELRLVIGNNAFYDMIGQYGEMIRPGDSIFYASMKEHVRDQWKGWFERAADGERFTVEVIGQSKDGSDIFSEVTFNPAYDHNHHLYAIGCYLRDVTQLRKSENKLVASEQRYRSLIEHASDAIFIFNENGGFQDVNSKACELLGYTRSELLTMKASDMVRSGEDLIRQSARLEQLKKGKPFVVTVSVVRKDGTSVEVESSSFPLPSGAFAAIVRDLTERKRLEKAEVEMQQRLSAIFNGTNDAILLTNDEGRYVQVNPAATRMLGYSEDELHEKTINDILVAKDDAALWTQFIEEGEQSGTIELTRKDGRTIICHYNATVDILPGVHLSILTDLTASKRIEKQIRESEARLAEAQRLAHLGNWEYNLATGEVWWSDELYNIFGRNKSDFLLNYTTVLSCIKDSDREKVDQHARYAYEGAGPFNLEYDVVTPWGEVRSVYETLYPKRDQSGNIVSLVGTSQNITDRKKAEHALKENEKKYRYLFEYNPVPIWVMEQSTLLFLDVNQATLLHYQYTRDEFLSMHYDELNAPEESERFHSFRQLLSDQSVYSGAWKHRKRDGSIINVEIVFHRIRFNGLGACLVSATDITEKLRREAELENSYIQLRQLAARMESVREAERARIAREVHDELGQQITGLKIDASWIAKRLTADNRPEKEKVLSMIALIDEMVLTVRRISTDLRPGILDDLGLIPALEWYGQEFQKRTGITVEFTSSVPDFSFERQTATNVFRVYQEALTNVARHARATFVHTTLERSRGCFALTIQDNGIGFDPRETKGKNALGLIGMKERVRLLNGALIVDSGVQKGTSIKLFVPENPDLTT